MTELAELIEIESEKAINASPCRPIRKTVYTLNINNYAPNITAITYPLIAAWCKKIGAEFSIITERKFPEWPIVYEKLQIYEKGRLDRNDWNIYVDSDAMIHPEMFDPTEQMSKDTVAHNGKDFCGVRWKYDNYFRRDGRNIGSCNWFTIASDWCLDLWHPLEDLTPDEAFANINLVVGEINSGVIDKQHLIDDYTLSRNIARFGLKHTTLIDMCEKLGLQHTDQNGRKIRETPYLWHTFMQTEAVKLEKMKGVLKTWGLER